MCSGPAELWARKLTMIGGKLRSRTPSPLGEPGFQDRSQDQPRCITFQELVNQWNARPESNQPISGCSRTPGHLATRMQITLIKALERAIGGRTDIHSLEGWRLTTRPGPQNLVPQARLELARALLLRQVGVPVSISHRGRFVYVNGRGWTIRTSECRGQSAMP